MGAFEHLADRLAELPQVPGVYLMKDAAGGLLYVGKSKNLRSRVRSYFQESADHSPKVERLVRHVKRLEWIVTDTEFEALMLECRLIREWKPPYNRKMKNPEAYAYITVRTVKGLAMLDVSRTLPERGGTDEGVAGRAKIAGSAAPSSRAAGTYGATGSGDAGDARKGGEAGSTRGAEKAAGPLAFGPFSSIRWTEGAVRALRELYRLQCSGSARKGSACLNHSLGLCLGVCRGRDEDLMAYGKAMDEIVAFLQGASDAPLERLRERMMAAAEACDFEAAARLRDDLTTLGILQRREAVVRFAEDAPLLALLEPLNGAAGGENAGSSVGADGDRSPGNAAVSSAPDAPAASAFKLFLVRRNRVLYSARFAAPQEPAAPDPLIGAVRAALREAWMEAVSTLASAPAPAELSRDEVDEARIIHAYVSGGSCRHAILQPAWLETAAASSEEAAALQDLLGPYLPS